jgi:hypothetical protein
MTGRAGYLHAKPSPRQTTDSERERNGRGGSIERVRETGFQACQGRNASVRSPPPVLCQKKKT